MSFGKINTFIEIISTVPTKDSEGFVNTGDTIIASIRAYKEDKNSSEKWANNATFLTASSLFRLRCIPGITITTANVIVCEDGRYNILSVENVRGRGMYIEVLAERVTSCG